MKLYKYRGIDNFQFAVDIIANQRIFCSKRVTLNDPMEGAFKYFLNRDEYEAQSTWITEVYRELDRLRVCALSKSFEEPLLWSHYASGFSGLAIEVEIDHECLKPVKYVPSNELPELDHKTGIPAKDKAGELLTVKSNCWEYEQEHRIVCSRDHFPVQVSQIILGHKIDEWMETSIMCIAQCRGINVSKLELHTGRITMRNLLQYS